MATPRRPAVVSSTGGPWPAAAPRGTAVRAAGGFTRPRDGVYSPEGTRWALSKRAPRRPPGAPARADGTDDEEEGDGREHEAAAKGGDDGDGDGADEGDHQELPAEASGRRQRPTDLSEGKAGEGHPAEREVVAYVFGEHERGGN